MLLYSRKKVRYRRDGYCWKKRKDGKTTREDHMKLKVQGMEVGAAVQRCSRQSGDYSGRGGGNGLLPCAAASGLTRRRRRRRRRGWREMGEFISN